MRGAGCKLIVFYAIITFSTSTASSVLSGFAQAASSAKAAGFPRSLSNSSYAATQFFSTVLNKSFATVTQCVKGDLGVSGTEVVRSSATTDGCSYGVWILFWFFLGLSLMLLMLSCYTGFCVGRTCCECCGKPCAPACGGNLPTITYSNMWAGTNLFFYLVLLFSTLLLTVLGYLSTKNANDAATRLADIVPSTFDYITDVRDSTRGNILSLASSVSAPFAAANKKLSSISTVNTTAAALLIALSGLDSLIFDLQVTPPLPIA